MFWFSFDQVGVNKGRLCITHDHEDGKGSTPLLGLAINVSQLTSHNSNGRARKGAAEEAEDEERRPIGRQSARQSEEGEKSKGGETQGPAANVLAERSPEDGAKDVADEVDGDGQHALLLGGDAEVVNYKRDSHTGKG